MDNPCSSNILSMPTSVILPLVKPRANLDVIRSSASASLPFLVFTVFTIGSTLANILDAAEAILSWNFSSNVGTNLPDLNSKSPAKPPSGVFSFLPSAIFSGTVSNKDNLRFILLKSPAVFLFVFVLVVMFLCTDSITLDSLPIATCLICSATFELKVRLVPVIAPIVPLPNKLKDVAKPILLKLTSSVIPNSFLVLSCWVTV